jgi:rod shape-determining protein MreD
MSLPVAAVGAIVAALLETSVLPDLAPAGLKPDLVFVLTVVATMMIGVEDGLTWAFLGGLMLDILLPERAPGGTSFVLLVCAGLAALVARFLPQRRIPIAVAAVFVLSSVYQLLSVVVLSATSGLAVVDPKPSLLLGIALLNAIVGVAAAAVARSLWIRYGAHDRMEW